MIRGRPARKGEEGFSLVEILVSIAIIGVLVVPLFRLFGAGLDSNDAARRVTTATYLAQGKVEALRYGSYDAVVSEPLAPVPGFPDYASQVTVVETVWGLKQAAVTVSWSGTGSARQVTLTTLVTQK